ncbi:MAG: hypothetical protein Q9227_007041 [Pyrenula ochraceoflavens]
MGAPVGLRDANGLLVRDNYDPTNGHAFAGVPITGYRYMEEGLLPKASCMYNESSEFFLAPFPVADGWSLRVFNAMGFLPNDASTMHAAAGLGSDQVCAMAAGSMGQDFNTTTSYMALAAGNGSFGKYGRLNNVQCRINFEPRRFSVEVNTTLKMIAVSPQQTINAPPYAHNITTRAVQVLDTMSGVFDTTIWISIIGDTFVHNIANIESRVGETRDGSAATLAGVKDSLESLIDDTLLAFGSADLMVYNDSHVTKATASVQAATFGNSRDIYIIFALNIAISLLYASSLFYTSRWPGVGKFNFTDVKSIIVGASAGGSRIAERAASLYRAKGEYQWVAAEDDKVVGSIKV